MWQLKVARATNLFSFKKIDYTIKNGVTTSVTGVNLDNSNQGSNGSGKSSLLELFALGITGMPLRKAKVEEVINDAAEVADLQLIFYNPGLKEEMIIRRRISRKEAQSCSIRTIIDNVDKTEEVSNISGLEQNNLHILNKLGISKDELFNNFLLSKYRYKGFLAASDNEKKEIINTFSNGVLVDKAITKLREDMEPIRKKQTEAQAATDKAFGRVEATEEQINAFEETQKEQKLKREELINEKNQQIAAHNQNIRLLTGSITEYESDMKAITGLINDLSSLEKNSFTVTPYQSIAALDIFWENDIANTLPLGEDNEGCVYGKAYQDLLMENEQTQNDLVAIRADLLDIKNGLNLLVEAHEKEQKNYDADFKAFNVKVETKKKNIDDLREQYAEKQASIKTIRQSIVSLENLQAKYENILAGTIVCPKCQHSFVLTEGVDIADIKKRFEAGAVTLTKHGESLTHQTGLLNNLQSKGEVANTELQKFRTENLPTKTEIDAISTKHQALLTKEISVNTKLAKLELRQTEFDKEVTALIKESYEETEQWLKKELDNVEALIKSSNDEISLLKQKKQICSSAISQLEEGADDSLKTLKASLEQYKQDYLNGIAAQDKVKKRLDALIEQEANFIKFKTHLANTKIDALSEITNSFLECIGSDLRIEFLGFKTLKTGKVRDKISVNLLRDGVDVGSLGKLSLGEQARIHLACILAMFKLTNINCEDCRGLDLLVLDEVLEGVDEPGLMGVIYALNELGITSLIVSQLKAAENYENVLTVQKENGESTLQ